MGDLTDKEASLVTRIVGGDELYTADVELIGGKRKLLTDATVTVEQVFGFDNFADSWFTIATAGAIGSTLRLQISAGTLDTTSPDSDGVAVDYTYTLIAADVGDELKLRDNFINGVNANANFLANWKASAVKDNPTVHITSKYIGEVGERIPVDSFLITTTGATTAARAFDNIKRRGKQNSGARDPRDKRIVTIGISGEVTSTPGGIGDLFLDYAMNGASSNMAVNGSVTPVVFLITPDTLKDRFIGSARFNANGNGIKFGQFLSINTNLTNGILVEVKSDDIVKTFLVIKSTDDMKHLFSFPAESFILHIQSGRDDVTAEFNFSAPFPLRKIGTFATDDYLKVTVRDNLSTLSAFNFVALGFQKEV